MYPLVSIITPAYKAEKYIMDCIRSVQNQTYENWEMIIVNDKSPDSTEELIKEAAEMDGRIRLISLSQNQGVVNARNTAIQAAKGQYIAFLDSDDVWFPEKLKKQIVSMEENKWPISYTSYDLMDDHGEALHKTVNAPASTTYKELLKGSNIGCLTVVVNKAMVGEFLMPKIHHEDYATWLMLLKRGFVAYGIPESLACYRKATGSLSGNKKKAAQWQWKVLREHEGLSLLKSSYYFLHYTINGIKKSL